MKLDHTAACEHLSRVDRHLARIIARYWPLPYATGNHAEHLRGAAGVHHLSAAQRQSCGHHHRRVKALFPENTKRIRTRRGLVDSFPSPEQILAAPEELLRSAGLSRNKLLAIRDLAAKTLDGTVPTLQQARRMSDDELVERLVTVRGIGRWTVEMLLMFRLGRPDVLPVDDYGVRKGFAKMRKLAELPKPKELMPLASAGVPIAAWPAGICGAPPR